MIDLITVGITSYVRPAGLLKTLQQITSQTYQNLEILISIDNPHSTELIEIAREFANKDSRIRCFWQERNLGINNNVLFLIGKATGKYFIWAADDDECKPDFIESLYLAMQKKDVTVVMSRVNHVFANGKMIDMCDFDKYILPKYRRYLLSYYAAGHDTLGYYLFGLWNTETLRKYIHHYFTAHPGDDNIMMADVILSGELGFINPILHNHYESWHTYLNNKEILKREYFNVWHRFFYLFRYCGRLIASPFISVQRKIFVPVIFARMGVRTAWFYCWHYPAIGIQILLKNRDLYKINQ